MYTLFRIFCFFLASASAFAQHARWSIERYKPEETLIQAYTFSQGTPLDVKGNFPLTAEVTTATITDRVYLSSATGYLSFDSFESGAPSMANADDISITSWCTRLSTMATHTAPYNIYYAGGADRGFIFWSNNPTATNRSYFYLYNTGNTGYLIQTVVNDTLSFICVTCSSIDNVTRSYINGVEVGTQTQAATKDIRYHASEVGSLGKGHQYIATINVSETRYYKKSLSAAEIKRMYQEGPHR